MPFWLTIAEILPGLLTASRQPTVRQTLVEAFHGPTLRVYGNDDLVGVEVGGAVKNVLAIATGIADAMPGPAGGPPGLGLNARAALITRGLAEMTRLGVALGAPDGDDRHGEKGGALASAEFVGAAH